MIWSRSGSTVWIAGAFGAGGNGAVVELRQHAELAALDQRGAADGPSKVKSTLLVSRPWVTSALPL